MNLFKRRSTTNRICAMLLAPFEPACDQPATAKVHSLFNDQGVSWFCVNHAGTVQDLRSEAAK